MLRGLWGGVAVLPVGGERLRRLVRDAINDSRDVP